MSIISHLPVILGDFRFDPSNPEEINALIVIGVIALVYFLPTAIAVLGKHPAALGIAVLNVTLGWTGIVWIVTFIWACIKPGKPVVIQQAFQTPSPPALPTKLRHEDELESLQRLRERKLISEDEFVAKRSSILDSI